MLTLILAEAELELVPDEIRFHTAVRAPARDRDRRPARTLLDASFHHDAMRDLRDGERRGRPDLTHFALLLGLDSILNRRDGLRIFVHTRNDELIRVRPDTRLMRHYPRFVGLMEQLFRNGRVPARGDDEPLFSLEPEWTLERVVKECARGPVVAFSEGARQVSLPAYLSERAAASPDLTVILGAFPSGDFNAPVATYAEEVIAIDSEVASVWSVEAAVLSFWEAATGVYGANALMPVTATPAE